MPDVDEIVTGRRREGAFAGVMTFMRKLLQSAVVFAVGPILDASGLVRNVKIQPRARVVNTAVTIMLVGSLGLMIFGFIVSLRFKLNRDTHTVLMDEIERFKKQPGTQPTPENRAIVEDLTGWKYEELWGKGKVMKFAAWMPVALALLWLALPLARRKNCATWKGSIAVSSRSSRAMARCFRELATARERSGRRRVQRVSRDGAARGRRR